MFVAIAGGCDVNRIWQAAKRASGMGIPDIDLICGNANRATSCADRLTSPDLPGRPSPRAVGSGGLLLGGGRPAGHFGRVRRRVPYISGVPGGAVHLNFGSAVAGSRDRGTGELTVGRGFRWLMGFHVLYSRVLLNAARHGLIRDR